MKILTLKNKQYAEIVTRAPAKMHLYSKALSFAHNRTLRLLHEDMARRFLKEKPWERGLKWRKTQALVQSPVDAMAERVPTGWVQVNIRLPLDLAKELEQLAISQGQSLSAVLYTALYWYTWFVYPPAHEVERRRKAKEKQQ